MIEYHADPATFYEKNYSELLKFSAWILNKQNFHVDEQKIRDSLTLFYLTKLSSSLKYYNSERGGFESYLRMVLSQNLPQMLEKIHWSEHVLGTSLDAQNEEGMDLYCTIPTHDIEYEKADLRHDMLQFMSWARAHHVKSLSRKIHVFKLSQTHRPYEIAQLLGVTKQRISQLLCGFKHDFDTFRRTF